MIAGVVIAHLAVIAIWLVCAGVVLGIGLLVQRHMLGTPVDGPDNVFAAVWVGLASTTLLLQLWHFILPIDGRALTIVVSAGAAGLATAAVRQPFRIRRPSGGQGLRLFVFCAIALWLANLSLGPLMAYDTGVYMIPGVEWTKAYRIVPGLASLYGRLAFNSSAVLLAALLESGPWQAAAPHLLDGFFLLLLAARIASRFPTGTRRDANDTRQATFDLILLTPLVAMAVDDQLLPSLSADVSVAVALFAGTSLLLGRLQREPSETPDRAAPIGAVCAFALALALKLSAAAFAATGSIIAIVLITRDVRERALRRRALAATLFLCALLTGTWMARGVITSGYPMYPSTVLAAPVEWRAPLEQAQAEAGFVAHFGRTWYSTDLANADSVQAYAWQGFHWLRPWASSIVRGKDHGLVSLGLLCSLAFGTGLLIRRGGATAGAARYNWLFVPAIAAIAFWFIASPRPSFGIAGAWVAAALPAAILSGRLPPRAGAVASVCIGLLLPLVPAAAVVRHAYPASWSRPGPWRWTLTRAVDPADWFREPAVGESPTYVTRSGLVLHLPSHRSLCERAPLPCTPTPARNLSLREAGDPGSGFVIDGPWQAERWPNSGLFLESWRRARSTR